MIRIKVAFFKDFWFHLCDVFDFHHLLEGLFLSSLLLVEKALFGLLFWVFCFHVSHFLYIALVCGTNNTLNY